MVSRMSRHMLSKSYGLYFDWLYGRLREEVNVQQLYRAANSRRHVFVSHVPNKDLWAAIFPAGFNSATDAEKKQRLLEASRQGKARVMDKPGRWPYPPFEEVSDLIAQAEPNVWLVRSDPATGVYCIQTGDLQDDFRGLAPLPDTFKQLVARVRRNNLYRLEAQKILADEKPSFNADAITSLVASLREIKNDVSALEATSITDMNLVLCTFGGDGGRSISVSDFVRSWNGSFVRTLPRTSEAVVDTLKTMIVEERAFAAAISAGLDRDPRFLEDRHGFEGYQMLHVHQQEHFGGKNETEIEKLLYEHAREVAREIGIDDRINYERYGLNRAQLDLPWSP